MRSISKALVLSLAALAAGCAEKSPGSTIPGAVDADNMCLRITDIQSIKALDDSTLIFTLNSGRMWKNTLADACPDLKAAMDFGYGIEYNADPDGQVCSNVYMFRVRNFGGVCNFGRFTPYTPKPISPAG